MKNKGLSITAALLALVMLGSGVFYFTKGRGGSPEKPAAEKETKAYAYEQSEYTLSPGRVTLASGAVLLPTGIDGIFYSADLTGRIGFFTFENGAVAPYGGTVKTVTATINKSYTCRQNLDTKLSYIEHDGKICGYGLFTTEISSAQADIYPYAFFKVVSKPAGYGSGCLLLIDFEKENFYSADKTYSEIFSFNISSGKAEKIFDNSTRLVDYTGAYRNDWTMLTEYFLGNMGNEKLFLSSRNYNNSDRGIISDIMVVGGSYKPDVKAGGTVGLWANVQPDGLRFLRGTATGFNSVSLKDSETVVASLEGNYFTDYLAYGDYVINKNSLALTNLLTGESKTLTGINITGADVFSVSPDGTKAVFASFGEANAHGVEIQSLIYYDITDGKAFTFAEPLLFSETASSFVWIDNDSVMHARAEKGDGSGVVLCRWSFAAARAAQP